MKILPPDESHNGVVPLNIMYYSGENFNEPDIATIIYKDIETDQKRIVQIPNPMIEVYIVKPEYRDYTHMRDFMEAQYCYPLTVHYRSRWYEIAKELGLADGSEAKTCPYVFGADIELENYYLMQFLLEYPVSEKPELSMGYLDIENDVINYPRIPEYGKAPINLVTYIDGTDKQVYTFILIKDAFPEKDEDCTEEELRMRTMFKEQSSHFLEHIDEFEQKLHDMFDESYPGMNYNLFTFANELDLMDALWKIIHAVDNDYIYVWNLPYDMSNLQLRPLEFNFDPAEFIRDERFEYQLPISFKEDTNPVAHKRKHICNTYTIPTFIDQMVVYAGIRSGRGKIPSLKLNAIAQTELQDEKLDYSESADIRHLFYYAFETSIIYNIKDVLLQYGIESKVKDMNTIFDRMCSNAVLPNQSFTTTKVVIYSLTLFGYERGVYVGTNRNKYQKENIAEDLSEDELDIYLDLYEDEEEEDEELEGSDSNTSKKREKYQGAFVMNPLYQHSTGIEVMGKEAKFIHDYVGDEDITSEYPSAIVIDNISNETLFGKVYLVNPEEFEIPIYDSFKFYGDERAKYKLDVSNFMLECYSERDSFDFGNLFLNLPDPSEVLALVDEHIEELLE